jgi:hypothetical protein
MKKVVLLFFCLSCLAARGQGLFLGPGDTFTYTFNSMSFQQVNQNIFYGFTLAFTNDVLTSGDSLKLELFENTVADTPFASPVFLGGSVPTLRLSQTQGSGTVRWADQQGTIRLTMQSGSIVFKEISVFTAFGGSLYGHTVPIPEPQALSLLMVGVLATGWIRRRLRSP